VDGALLYLWPWLERKLAPGEQMPFVHETVIRRYKTNWRAQSKAFYSEQAQVLREARIAKLAALFRDPKLPAPFRILPSHNVTRFQLAYLSYSWPDSQTFIADAECHRRDGGRFDREQRRSPPETAGIRA